MRISLIGMSGAGKSYWSSKLEETGFHRICCDDIIEQRLNLKISGKSETPTLGEWMGAPYETGYRERAEQYLSLEKEVLREALNYLGNPRKEYPDIVLDTTGSVIYTGSKHFERLRRHSTTIYLSLPAGFESRMSEDYLANPRAIYWSDAFQATDRESNGEAIQRCYANLLKQRTKKYEELADLTLDYNTRIKTSFTVWSFMDFARGNRRGWMKSAGAIK